MPKNFPVLSPLPFSASQFQLFWISMIFFGLNAFPSFPKNWYAYSKVAKSFCSYFSTSWDPEIEKFTARIFKKKKAILLRRQFMAIQKNPNDFGRYFNGDLWNIIFLRIYFEVDNETNSFWEFTTWNFMELGTTKWWKSLLSSPSGVFPAGEWVVYSSVRGTLDKGVY